MTELTPAQRAARFAALVVPAAEQAGYTGHGAKARFGRDTGIGDSSVTRLWQGKGIPEPRFYEAIADVTGLDLGLLLVEGGVISAARLRSLSETDPSQVESRPTPEQAADRLGISTDNEVGRRELRRKLDRIDRPGGPETHDHGDNRGGAESQM